MYFTGSVVDFGSDGGEIVGSEVIVTPLGKNSRRMRLRFSLLPRSHGECGWAKYTANPVAVIVTCRAISVPQSPGAYHGLELHLRPLHPLRVRMAVAE